MIDQSILEVFGNKSQDGDKVKGLLLNALMRKSYEKGGEVEGVNWDEILKEKGLDLETVGQLNKGIGRNLESWEMYKNLFDPEHYKTMQKDYEETEWGGEQLQSMMEQAEWYKQYLKDYSKTDPSGATDVRFGTKPSGGFGVQDVRREKEKGKGIMALLQRLLPGGKTGYKE